MMMLATRVCSIHAVRHAADSASLAARVLWCGIMAICGISVVASVGYLMTTWRNEEPITTQSIEITRQFPHVTISNANPIKLSVFNALISVQPRKRIRKQSPIGSSSCKKDGIPDYYAIFEQNKQTPTGAVVHVRMEWPEHHVTPKECCESWGYEALKHPAEDCQCGTGCNTSEPNSVNVLRDDIKFLRGDDNKNISEHTVLCQANGTNITSVVTAGTCMSDDREQEFLTKRHKLHILCTPKLDEQGCPDYVTGWSTFICFFKSPLKCSECKPCETDEAKTMTHEETTVDILPTETIPDENSEDLQATSYLRLKTLMADPENRQMILDSENIEDYGFQCILDGFDCSTMTTKSFVHGIGVVFTVINTSIDSQARSEQRMSLSTDVAEYLAFQLQTGFRVFLHEGPEFSGDDNTANLFLSLGATTETYLQMQEVRKINTAAHPCSDKDGATMKKYATCVQRCEQSRIQQRCGCSSYLLPEVTDALRLCKTSIENETHCMNKAGAELNPLDCACNRPCTEVRYALTTTARPLKSLANTSHVVIKNSEALKTVTIYQMQWPKNPWRKLAEIGNVLGLISATSIITIIEFFVIISSLRELLRDQSKKSKVSASKTSGNKASSTAQRITSQHQQVHRNHISNAQHEMSVMEQIEIIMPRNLRAMKQRPDRENKRF